MQDLNAGVIRAIGDPGERFTEDKLRMLRGVRFAARFAFELEPATASAIERLAPAVNQVSRERVRDELTRMLTEGQARRAFELLDATGLLVQVLPEVVRLKGVAQPPQYHPEGDVWVHTLLLLDGLPAGCPATFAWAALLHDIGKPATFRVAPDRIRFDGHVEAGIRIAEEICRRLRFPESRDGADLVAHRQPHALCRRAQDEGVDAEALLPPGAFRSAPGAAPARLPGQRTGLSSCTILPGSGLRPYRKSRFARLCC